MSSVLPPLPDNCVRFWCIRAPKDRKSGGPSELCAGAYLDVLTWSMGRSSGWPCVLWRWLLVEVAGSTSLLGSSADHRGRFLCRRADVPTSAAPQMERWSAVCPGLRRGPSRRGLEEHPSRSGVPWWNRAGGVRRALRQQPHNLFLGKATDAGLIAAVAILAFVLVGLVRLPVVENGLSCGDGPHRSAAWPSRGVSVRI